VFLKFVFNKFTLAQKFLHYYSSASNGKGHGIHSPFVYQFVREILIDKKKYYAYSQVEHVRKRMLKDHSVITVDDKGAGSAVAKTKTRRVSEIARTALKPKKYAQLLFRMVNFYQPQNILELGTSLGITTSYLATANTTAKVVTIEGAPAVAHKAVENFSGQELSNVRLVCGGFEDVLPATLASMQQVDFAFIDGNHRKAPTLQYFEQILQHSHSDTIFVFDDIHWSQEMEEAWAEIKQHPLVTCTIDLFFIGIVLLKREFKQREHFVIRF
jgi:predicted O-methyltransferase YrrM